jgi:hypothetical protein
VAVSFINGGNRRKPTTCGKSLRNFITSCCNNSSQVDISLHWNNSSQVDISLHWNNSSQVDISLHWNNSSQVDISLVNCCFSGVIYLPVNLFQWRDISTCKLLFQWSDISACELLFQWSDISTCELLFQTVHKQIYISTETSSQVDISLHWNNSSQVDYIAPLKQQFR